MKILANFIFGFWFLFSYLNTQLNMHEQITSNLINQKKRTNISFTKPLKENIRHLIDFEPL